MEYESQTTAFSVILIGVAIWLIITMSETHSVPVPKPKRQRKTKNDPAANTAVTNRSFISANWQNLVSTQKLEKKETVAKDNTTKYTGPFRRTKKQNATSKSVLENHTAQKPNMESFLEETTGLVPVFKSNADSKRGGMTKFIAIDCEMVGIGDGTDNMLARVSLVNKFGDCIYDKFVKPREEVIDYRTSISGIRKEDMLNGEPFEVVQKEVADIIVGRVLVGHSVKNDLAVLFLSHPNRNIRDTARYKPFRKITRGNTPSLKRLAKELLGVDIQSGEHSSVEDARAVMQVYCSVAQQWESSLKMKRGARKHD